MNFADYFNHNPQVETTTIPKFINFGSVHWMILLTLAVFGVSMILLSRKYDKFKNYFKWFMLITIPLQEISYKLWKGIFDPAGYDWETVFSLHMCSMSIIIITILLIKYNQTLFEVLYFWGLGGATQALLTPGVGDFGFPHYRMLQTFYSHGMIVIAVFYFMFAERKRLRKGTFKRVYIITHIYAVYVFIHNFIFQTNFMFLRKTPDEASLIDALGAWPFYIIWLEVILLVMFGILYLPPYPSNKRRERLEAGITNADGISTESANA